MERKSILRLKNVVEELNTLSRLCEYHDNDAEVDSRETGPISRRLILIADELLEINEDFYVESDGLRLLGLVLANSKPGFTFLGNLMGGLSFFLDSVVQGLRSGGKAANPDLAEGSVTDVDSWLGIQEREEPDYMKPKEEIDLADLDIEDNQAEPISIPDLHASLK